MTQCGTIDEATFIVIPRCTEIGKDLPMKVPGVFAAVCLLSSLACGGHDDDDKNNERMAPGQNCMACHTPGGPAGEASFTVAGTVFGSSTADTGSGLAGVSVIITDANGLDTLLTTNAAGNFFTRAALALPLKKAAVGINAQRTAMSAAPDGDCNRCHTQPAAGGAPGRIHAP